MRTIKYRLWDKKYKKMLTSKQQLSSYNISTIDGHVLFIDGHDCCDRIIPLEYTGTKDRNGKDIYEGDTINVTDPFAKDKAFNRIVRFDEGMFGFMWPGYTKLDQILKLPYFETEVIGNIYENPGLLKGIK